VDRIDFVVEELGTGELRREGFNSLGDAMRFVSDNAPYQNMNVAIAERRRNTERIVRIYACFVWWQALT
jgi:hypothetical protein